MPLRRLRTASLRTRLLLLGTLTSIAALMLSGLAIVVSSYLLMRRDVVRNISAQAAIVADNTTAAIRFSDADAADETLRALRAMSSVEVACLYDRRPAILGEYVPNAGGRTCPAAPPSDRLAVGWAAIEIVRAVDFRETRIGTLYLQANLDEVWGHLQTESLAILVAFAIGSVAALLIAARLREGISAPILALSRTAAEISARGDYSLRAVKETSDEIGALVETFNSMIEQAQLRDDELRSAIRLKDEFLATLSHELRTPLNAIVGWLQVLRLSPADPAVTERALSGLERNARVQVRLIEDLLDISSIERGQLRLTFGAVDLMAVVQASIDVVRPTAEAKGLTVVAPAEGPARLVLGDAGRLEQVLWNLLSNAIKFTPAHGHVTISIVERGEEYVVRIEDDGIGIAPDFLPHVFDRFRQGDSSYRRQYGGLGVGLALAQELVERHGGRIVAESAGPNQGAAFSLWLPKGSVSRIGSTAGGRPAAM